jgi:uncharacterized protein
MAQNTTWTAAAFEVGPSTIDGAGLGLFARETIWPEDTIGYYTGVILSEAELYNPNRPFSAYLLWVCRNHIINGEGPTANYTRYINHAAEPNAFLIVSTRWKSARFEALRRIDPGEEIFFNYSEEFWGAKT